MNIDRLRYFTAVVETRNLRRAAELVGIAPASMSKAISTLESDLGHPLLRPEGRGIEITEKGLEIYRLSATLLDEHRRFLEAVSKNLVQRPAKLRIATFEVFSSHFLSAFLQESGVDSDLLLLEMEPGRMERAILDGIVDYGITYLPSPDAALEFVEIGSFEMGIFGKRSWEKAEFESWSFAIPTTEVHIHSQEFAALDLWPPSAPKRRIRFEFELLETALQTSSAGLSVLHCPSFIAHLHNRRVKQALQLERLANPPGYRPLKATKVFLVLKKGSNDSVLERKLAKFMRAIR